MLDIKVDTIEFAPALAKLQAISADKWPRIIADATNETAYYVLNKYKQQLPQYLDRPTPWTVNSMYVKRATPSDLDGSVQWKNTNGNNSAGQYLQPETFGGNRAQKPFERALQTQGLMPQGYVAVPTEHAPIDSFGNVPPAFLNQVLNYLKANPQAIAAKQIKKLRGLSTKNFIKGVAKAALNREKLAAKEARARAKALKFFTVIKGQGGNPLPSGIYERLNAFGHGFSASIKRIFVFAPTAKYTVSFPFEEIGTKATLDKFPIKLDEAIAKALAKK